MPLYIYLLFQRPGDLRPSSGFVTSFSKAKPPGKKKKKGDTRLVNRLSFSNYSLPTFNPEQIAPRKDPEREGGGEGKPLPSAPTYHPLLTQLLSNMRTNLECRGKKGEEGGEKSSVNLHSFTFVDPLSAEQRSGGKKEKKRGGRGGGGGPRAASPFSIFEPGGPPVIPAVARGGESSREKRAKSLYPLLACMIMPRLARGS